jgi:CheY-like chemotaxis protein
MTPDPVILILEDERSQILTLRAQLTGLGKLVEFMDPEPALEYAGANLCDAAIVDVRMSRSTMDGLAFVRALRQFDKDLAIIIRTASDSDAIADGAIELRAIKRAVKSKTTLAELRSSTQEAIRETRERRETNRSARATDETKTKLSQALGAYDLRLAAAEVYRGLVHAMRSQLTGLSALASVLKEDAAGSGSPAFAEHAGKSAELVGRMVDSVNAFLDGPYGENSTASRAAVNVCLEALRQFFHGVERWAAEGKRLALRDLLSDTLVECAPLELMNGLRHLVEYFLLQAPPGSEISLSASILQGSGPVADRLGRAACVLNRGAVRREGPYVLFRVSAPLPALSVEEVRDAFSSGPEGGRTGNLNVLGKVLSAARGTVLLGRHASGLFLFDALFPVAL